LARRLAWALRGQRANQPWPYELFCTSTLEPQRVWLSKEAFIGPYGSLSKPAALTTRAAEPAAEVWGCDLCCAFDWSFELDPGTERSWELIGGLAPAGKAAAQARQLADTAWIDEQEQKACEHWRQRVSRLSLKTPCEELNLIQNGWTQYQVLIKSHLSSAPSYYHASDGSPGLRDALQDAFGLSLLEPERARQMILRLASFQFSDGSASHRAPLVPLPPERSEKSDLPLWLTLPTLQYIRETGDVSILNERVPYADGGEGSLMEHIRAGLEWSMRDVGPHGLPLIRYGDWNDALDGVGPKGKGESVFLAQFLAFALRDAATLARLAGWADQAQRWLATRDELYRLVNDHCWDGDRYIRAFHDDGRPVGCRADHEGSLYLNPQVWAVLADLGPQERLTACMDTVWRELDTEFGIRCLAPPYSRHDPRVGLISCFPPGVKENGAIFSHAMAFCLVAELKLGRADRAWQIIQKSNPIKRAREHPEYAVEPYVYCQFVAGPETNLAGQGFHHWLTGTCNWMQYAIVNWLLGARAELEGLRIDPCVPAHWRGFELRRPFRQATIELTVDNAAGVTRGVRSLIVNGQPIEGNLIKGPFKPGSTVKVVAVMG